MNTAAPSLEDVLKALTATLGKRAKSVASSTLSPAANRINMSSCAVVNVGPVFASKVLIGIKAELFAVMDSVKPAAVTVTLTNFAQLGIAPSSLTLADISRVFQWAPNRLSIELTGIV